MCVEKRAGERVGACGVSPPCDQRVRDENYDPPSGAGSRACALALPSSTSHSTRHLAVRHLVWRPSVLSVVVLQWTVFGVARLARVFGIIWRVGHGSGAAHGEGIRAYGGAARAAPP